MSHIHFPVCEAFMSKSGTKCTHPGKYNGYCGIHKHYALMESLDSASIELWKSRILNNKLKTEIRSLVSKGEKIVEERKEKMKAIDNRLDQICEVLTRNKIEQLINKLENISELNSETHKHYCQAVAVNNFLAEKFSLKKLPCFTIEKLLTRNPDCSYTACFGAVAKVLGNHLNNPTVKLLE